jgi:hypothetical protein
MSPHKNQRNKKNCLPSCLTPFKRSDLIVAAIVKGEKQEGVGKYLRLKKIGIGSRGAGKIDIGSIVLILPELPRRNLDLAGMGDKSWR